MKNAYSIPHPVPPKITPKARMVPATAPISLLVAMLTVWREKGRFFKEMITSYMSEMKTWNNSSKEYLLYKPLSSKQFKSLIKLLFTKYCSFKNSDISFICLTWMPANISVRSFPINVRLLLLACDCILVYWSREHLQLTTSLSLKQPKHK